MMPFINLKRIKAPQLSSRLFAILCFILGMTAVWIWPPPETASSRFLVKVLPEPETMTGNRDLSQYHFGGGLDYQDADHGTQERFEKEVRGFILTQWREKARGYVTFNPPCIDCSNPQYFFIEPDGDGTWTVVWRMYDSNKSRSWSTTIYQETAYDIQLRHVRKGDRTVRTGVSYLSFLDKDGKEVQRF